MIRKNYLVKRITEIINNLHERGKFMETNENPYEKYNQYADSGFEWQEECLNEIQDKNNVIISSPTGSGKTRVFLEWAKGKEERPIIITAPIKALSNQRYRVQIICLKNLMLKM